MKKVFDFIIHWRYYFLVGFLILAGFSAYFMGNVKINNDLTQYLPKDSPTAEGVSILENQFGNNSTLKVVFSNLSDTEKATVLSELSQIENVSRIENDNTDFYNNGDYTLFILHIPYTADSTEAKDVLQTVENNYQNAIIGGEIYTANQPVLPPYLIIVSFIVLIVLLFIFTSSWIEPFIFLATLGIAIVINMGTNILFDSISITTHSIAALLQVCLSIDYSIILLNRYKQEKMKTNDNITAMKETLNNAFSSIAGSSFTTIVGLLSLLFLSFRIGQDMGLVLAKGVFISLLTVFFILPTFILLFDKVIEKTKKWSLHIKTKRLSNFSYKTKIIIPIIFVFVFAGSFFLRGNINIGYILPTVTADKASDLFPDRNQMVVLYDNNDELEMESTINQIENNPHVTELTSYSTTIGKQMSATELAMATGMDSIQISGILSSAGTSSMSIYDFISYVLDHFSLMLSSNQLQQLTTTKSVLEETYSQLVGTDYSRIILTVDYPGESDETFSFIQQLQTTLSNDLEHSHYMLGSSVMAEEISHGFNKEYITVTLIAIVAIFIIVAITFKSITIPIILVAIIQTAIFLSTGVLGILGSRVYFLSLLVVQAILMGATIDYGILFTSYFKEANKEHSLKDALKMAYKGSIHTILTSASILFVITGLLGLISSNSTILEVLRALAVGTFSSTLLILIVLPSILVLVKKIIIKTQMNTLD